MYLWRGIAAAGLGALALAGLALLGTLLAVEPARPVARELVLVAYVAFFAGVVALLGAALARALTQLRHAVGTGRSPE